MMFMNLSNIANLNIKGADYRCIISGIIWKKPKKKKKKKI